MDNSIYEVERDEYVTFLGQLDKNQMDIEEYALEETYIIKIISKNTNAHLCTRIINNESGEEKYYIFNYPEADERIEPKPVMQVALETKEEVQAFFDALNKLQKEKKNG